MPVSLQADCDLIGPIIRGVRRAAPEVDIQSALDGGLINLSDPEVLRAAAAMRRVLVSQDRRTMAGHFARFLRGSDSPGVIVLRKDAPIAGAVEALVIIALCSEPKDWINRIDWIPF
jgi:hypothetical protein